jgi:hypothetical protein
MWTVIQTLDTYTIKFENLYLIFYKSPSSSPPPDYQQAGVGERGRVRR